MKNQPTLTPFQALKKLNEVSGTNEIIHEGFKYFIGAPQMCDDPEFFYPVAFKDGIE